jgi:hypothetical protein
MSKSASPKDRVLGSALALALMSFLAGVFLMLGIQLVRADPLYLLVFLMLPLLIFAGALHARRIQSALAELQ